MAEFTDDPRNLLKNIQAQTAQIALAFVTPARRPVFVEEAASSGRREMFYIRLGNATRALDVKDALAYAGAHWGT